MNLQSTIQAALSGTLQASKTFDVKTIAEFKEAAAQLLAAQNTLWKSGKRAHLRSGKGKSVQLSTDEAFIRVTLKEGAKQTAVTETSRHAYHTSDFSTQAAQVAGYVFDRSQNGGDVTRAEIADALKIQEGRVAARVNVLLKQYENGGYTAPSGEYRLVLTTPRISRFQGASDKPNEAMLFEKISHASQGEQKELF